MKKAPGVAMQVLPITFMNQSQVGSSITSMIRVRRPPCGAISRCETGENLIMMPEILPPFCIDSSRYI